MNINAPDTLKRAEFRVLVCGDRDWIDQELVNWTLDVIHAKTPIHKLIEGEARGADTCGKVWAISRIGKEGLMPFPADWKRYGRAAGPIRNRKQFDEGRPDLVLAFHDDIGASRGTKDMLAYAEAMGCQTRLVTH